MKKNNETRNAEATKQSILAAAEKAFAEKGFSGTTIRDISLSSGASGPLILFHFRDKKGLYQAVKAAIVKRYVDSESRLTPPGDQSLLCLDHFAESMFRFYRDNPTMIRLADWGRLEGDTDLWPGEDEWHHMYLDHIHEAQVRGEIRDDITPLHISIMICGAIHLWWEYHDHFLKRLGIEGKPVAADGEYFRQCLAFVRRGLCNEPRQSPSREDAGAENGKSMIGEETVI